MDLRLLGRVLWRYRILMLAGWILAIIAAFFSIVKVSGDSQTYRQSETFSAVEDIYVTERGFVEGRTNLPEVPVPGGRGTVPSTADPDRLAGLTTVYVQLVDSDPVRDILLRDGPVEGVVVAEQFTFDGGRGGLPMIRLTAAGPTAASAIDLAHRQTAAFQEYIASEQERSRIKPEDRVQIEVLRRAASAEVVAGRSFVGAGIAFIAILAVFVAAALILNNIRSRGTPDAGDEWRVPDYRAGAPDETGSPVNGHRWWSAPPYPSSRRTDRGGVTMAPSEQPSA